MARDFEAKKPEISLRDFIALLMPKPPTTNTVMQGESEKLIAEMKARYDWADRVIKEVR